MLQQSNFVEKIKIEIDLFKKLRKVSHHFQSHNFLDNFINCELEKYEGHLIN